jgi:hypothetical protein
MIAAVGTLATDGGGFAFPAIVRPLSAGGIILQYFSLEAEISTPLIIIRQCKTMLDDSQRGLNLTARQVSQAGF